MPGDSAKLGKVVVGVDFPFFKMEAEWEPDPRERQAAWELYVELMTRVSAQELDLDEGLLRESLSSLHSLFATSREILRRGGPDIGALSGSVGALALGVLNKGLRPFLSKWHPRLQAWEFQRPTDKSALAHERDWKDEATLRGELEGLRKRLWVYADALAKIAGVRD
jgi:hypothetical protein